MGIEIRFTAWYTISLCVRKGGTNMVIRKLVAEDYEPLLKLYLQLDKMHVEARPDYFLHRNSDEAYPKDTFLHNLAYPDCIQLGAFAGSSLVGFAEATLWNESGMRKDINTVCLDNIFVMPAYRRRGIAARLFAEVEIWAKERSAVRLELHTWDFNKGAIAMYKAMGMKAQRYVLEKKLQP